MFTTSAISAAGLLRAAAILSFCIWVQPPILASQPTPSVPIPAPTAPPTLPPASPSPPPPTSAPPPAAEAPPNPDQEYELTLRDGRIITGRLLEKTQEHVLFTVGGVPTKFPLRSIENLKTLPTVEERYNTLKPTIDPTDAPGLIRLARWLHSHDRYDLALTEVTLALKADPGNPDATELQRLISEQRKLIHESELLRAKRKALERVPPSNADNDHGQNTNTNTDSIAKGPLPPAFPLLTDEQINIIRVYEVSLSDPPKMTIPQTTIEAFLDTYGGQRGDGNASLPQSEQGRKIYLRKKPLEILADMFALKARDFYPRVKVLENPRSMQLFRDNVHKTWLINSCATTKCHGGEEAGRLRLFNQRAASDAAAYTNFLILDRYRIQSADSTDAIPLIDYNEPARSPLLQMGIPKGESKFPHPPLDATQRVRPAFQSEKDDRFVQAVEWIKSMYAKRTDYPIDYTPPTGRRRSSPSPEQAPR